MGIGWEGFEVHPSPDLWMGSLILGRSHTEIRTLLSETGGRTVHKMAETWLNDGVVFCGR